MNRPEKKEEQIKERILMRNLTLPILSAKEINAREIVFHIKQSIKNNDIFDYEKDIVPMLHKFLDNNPNMCQQDFLLHYRKALELN